MDENNKIQNQNQNESQTQNQNESQKPETIGAKIKKSWLWNNRGKIGFILGSVTTFILGNVLGGGGSTTDGTDSDSGND